MFATGREEAAVYRECCQENQLKLTGGVRLKHRRGFTQDKRVTCFIIRSNPAQCVSLTTTGWMVHGGGMHASGVCVSLCVCVCVCGRCVKIHLSVLMAHKPTRQCLTNIIILTVPALPLAPTCCNEPGLNMTPLLKVLL